MDIQTNKFQELWNDFIASFKGSLMMEAKKQRISFPIAKMALSEAVSTWLSEYTINGRWLYKLLAEEPAKGDLVKEIITKDITLTEVKTEDAGSENLKYLVPAGAGIAGYLVSYFANFATLATILTTIAPMAVAYPLTKNYLSERAVKGDDKAIEAYVAQLNKYKESILSALMA